VARGPGYPLGAARRGIRWQFSRDDLPTLRAADGVLAVLGNDWFQRRQFPNLGAAQRRDIRQVRGQRRLTGRALLRLKLNRVMHLIRRDQRTLMARVTNLTAGFAPACRPRRTGRCGRRVGGGWFGRGARGLAELGLELPHYGFEISEPATLRPHDVEQTEQRQLNGLRRLRPVVG